MFPICNQISLSNFKGNRLLYKWKILLFERTQLLQWVTIGINKNIFGDLFAAKLPPTQREKAAYRWPENKRRLLIPSEVLVDFLKVREGLIKLAHCQLTQLRCAASFRQR